MEGEVGHLPARDPGGDLDDEGPAVGDDQLRKGDPVLSPSVRTARVGDPLGLLERIAEEPRRVRVDPADAEAVALRPEPVGEEERVGVAAAGDDEPVQLEPVHELLDDRLAGGRLGEGGVEVALEVVERRGA